MGGDFRIDIEDGWRYESKKYFHSHQLLITMLIPMPLDRVIEIAAPLTYHNATIYFVEHLYAHK